MDVRFLLSLHVAEFSPLTRPSSLDQTLLAGLKGDPQESSIWLTTTGPKLPWFVRDFLTAIIQHVLGDAIFVRVLRSSRMKSVTETQAWAHERCVLRVGVPQTNKSRLTILRISDVYAAEFRTEGGSCFRRRGPKQLS